MRRRYFAFLLLGCAALFLSACSSLLDPDQTATGAPARLIPGHSLGQSFVSRHGGLDGLQVWLAPEPGSQGLVHLRLRASADAGADLATATLPLGPQGTLQPYQFSFPPLGQSNNRDYYAVLDFEGQGGVQVATAGGAAYRDGSLYEDGRPAADGQLTFRLAYAWQPLLLSAGRELLVDAGLLVVAVLVFILPGWALVAALWRRSRPAWGDMLGLAAGLSMAFYTVWLLWTDVFGLHLGALNVWLPVGAAVLAILFCYRQARPAAARLALARWASSAALWPDLALLAVVGLVFVTRIFAVHALVAPSWGDAVQHAAIGQLMLDRGGLFNSWLPYAPYRTLSVHFGFSAFVAALGWALPANGTQAALLGGQLVNGIAALSIYPLATRIAGGKRWAGVGAVIVAGLLSPLPGYYVNWGRFAQLAGQAILPVALWFLLDALERARLSWPPIVVAGLVAAGMTLTYYRMPYYYAVFVIAWLAGYGFSHWRLDLRQWLLHLLRLLPIGVLIVLLIWPYRGRLAGGSLEGKVSAGLEQTSRLAVVLGDYRAWLELPKFVPWLLQALVVIAVIWSLWRRRWVVAAVGLWILELALLVAGQLIHIPGTNLLQNFAIIIALYIPVSLLVGWLVAEVITWAGRRGRPAAAALTAALLMLISWGAYRQANIVDAGFILVNRPDMTAMTWIRQNTPSDARFLVEGFRIYAGESAVGADAGWWLPLLAGRANTMPPQYAMLNEAPDDPGYTQQIVDLYARLETASPASPEGLAALCRQGITHVYVGQGQGGVGMGVRQLFSVDQLAGSPQFRQVYHQDRVYVFALDPTICQSATHG